MVCALVALILPGQLSGWLSLADHSQELARNDQLRAATPEQQREHLEGTYSVVRQRLHLLRTRLLKSFAFMASAVVMAVTTHHLGLGIPTTASAIIIGSVFCFAWSTLGRLGWSGQSFKGDTTVERLDLILFNGLYWVGMYLGTLAAL